MRLLYLLVVILFSVVFGAIGGQLAPQFDALKPLLGMVAKAPETPPVKETAYERVMRTQTLRCGYVVHPPHVVKDPSTGMMSGAIVDILKEAGNLLKIKIEWLEEVGWGNTVEALRSGRVDAICTDFWMNPVEGRYVNYSVPLYYETLVAYGRADDHRFDNTLDAANNVAITFSATDGSLSGIVAQQDFPLAKVVFLPNLTDTAQVLKEVDAGKGDLALVAGIDGANFEKNNPGRLRNLTPDRPVRSYAATIALPQNDMALKTMLDSAFVQLLGSRFVDKTLEKNGLAGDVVYRVARPYEVPSPPAALALSPASSDVQIPGAPVTEIQVPDIPVSNPQGLAIQLPALPGGDVAQPVEGPASAPSSTVLVPAGESGKTVPTQKAPVPVQGVVPTQKAPVPTQKTVPDEKIPLSQILKTQ